MEKAKFKLWCAQHPVWVNVFCLSIVAFVIYRIVVMTNLTKIVENMSDTSIAVFGTLLGAIVGGLFTLIGTHFDNKKQLKRQAEIKRKNLIYKPLYDELAEIHFVYLVKRPYPQFINFERQKLHYPNSPQYNVWERIKIDTRFFETPECLVNGMDCLYEKIKEYLNVRQKAEDLVGKILNDVLEEEVGKRCPIINIGMSFDEDVLSENNSDIFTKLDGFMKFDETLVQEERDRISSIFYKRCLENDELSKIKNCRKEWVKQQEQVLIMLLE